MKNFTRVLFFTLLILMLCISTLSCSKHDNEESQQSGQQQSGPGRSAQKPPEVLENIEKDIEHLIMTLNGPAIMMEENEGGSVGQSGGQTGGQTGSTDQKESTGSKDGQQAQDQTKNQGQAAQMTKAKGIFKPMMSDEKWNELYSLVNNMHYEWNSFMPQAAENGANNSLLGGFSSALNKLTGNVIGKDVDSCVFSANQAYSFLPDFYNLFDTGDMAELKRITYYTRSSILDSLSANWAQSDQDMSSLKSSWSVYKNVVSKDFPEQSSMLDFSISEFERVITERNQPLIDIKGRVSLSNIMTLEKLSEKNTSGQSGQSNK